MNHAKVKVAIATINARYIPFSLFSKCIKYHTVPKPKNKPGYNRARKRHASLFIGEVFIMSRVIICKTIVDLAFKTISNYFKPVQTGSIYFKLFKLSSEFGSSFTKWRPTPGPNPAGTAASSSARLFTPLLVCFLYRPASEPINAKGTRVYHSRISRKHW